ncbi:hypothetical protein FX988_00278 [Paraglaciecola mesophila]|uniref:Uncharacterized protein n=1 Tax=Paraglaciecola mesophila TaxID=197222 RepID=A0A857JDG7_9ALTE|nr:hypothetical protein FX988_00278 [Paraglaciecola mesophila]
MTWRTGVRRGVSASPYSESVIENCCEKYAILQVSDTAKKYVSGELKSKFMMKCHMRR